MALAGAIAGGAAWAGVGQPETVEVIFSDPGPNQAGVALKTPVRLQFSDDMDAATFDGRVRLAYSAEDSRERGEPEPPVIEFEVTYVGADRALTIRPRESWLRFREVRLRFLDGIRGVSGAPLRPFELAFTTGGS
jgi:hypothetical protein